MALQYIHRTTIFVTTRFTGLHQWDQAPESVGYLRDLHRHLFGVRVEIEVLHNDRELEYHTVQKALAQFIVYELSGDEWRTFWSCEDIAGRILVWAQQTYRDRGYYKVTVDEDGENGSTMEARA